MYHHLKTTLPLSLILSSSFSSTSFVDDKDEDDAGHQPSEIAELQWKYYVLLPANLYEPLHDFIYLESLWHQEGAPEIIFVEMGGNEVFLFASTFLTKKMTFEPLKQ